MQTAAANVRAITNMSFAQKEQISTSSKLYMYVINNVGKFPNSVYQ